MVWWTTHPLKDFWVVSNFWLSQIKLLWTIVFRFWYRHRFSLCVCMCVCSQLFWFFAVLWTVYSGSSVHEIFQARILERVAISFCRGSSWSRDQTCVSYISCIGRRVPYRLCYLGSPFSTVRTQHMTELNFLKILGKVLMAQAEQYLEDTRDEDEVVKTAWEWQERKSQSWT